MTRMPRAKFLASVLLASVSMTSFASAQEANDPFEPVNRGFFAINDVLDTIIVKPVVTVYNTILPQPVRTGVSNVFGNLDDAFIAANHALQGRGKDAGTSLGRVILNSTIGIGGLFDVASLNGMQKNEGDFGQTLGVWGMGPGPYVVLPVMGPSTVRETVGRVARTAGDPRTYMTDPWNYGLKGAELVQVRADNVNNTNLIESSSFDKYSFTRNLYLQRREALVQSGREAAGLR